ncbi:MAG: Hsp70 family protein [Proteobacteria bacterium]|nr:Hsp70 family protein [Pseudomonadota bacterium]
MPSASPAASIGIDFGTSNTVVALARNCGQVETLRFDHGGASHSGYASTLCFSPGGMTGPQVEGGPWAIDRFLEGSTPLRFIQSFKTFAASSAFQQTTIFRQRFSFEDLLAAFLQTLEHHAGSVLDLSRAHVTVGRPVAFAGSAPDDALAMERYRKAFGQLGVKHAHYVYEPLGAAFSFARRLDHDATVLVADFGGGTSDFSVMRFARRDGRLRAEPLGHAGIGIAGDTFDARIVDHIVAPRLGKGGSYRSFEKVLPLPRHFYATLSRWNELAFMKGSKELRDLQELTRFALDPEPLHDFISLVENDLGYPLYRAVSVAKVALSAQEAVDFEFSGEGLSICAQIERPAFERWISDDLARIAATVDEVLAKSGVAADDVEKVFLTGGTSFVPAVQALFAERFGAEKLTAADQFESIAQGLALIGLSENPDQWAFAA